MFLSESVSDCLRVYFGTVSLFKNHGNEVIAAQGVDGSRFGKPFWYGWAPDPLDDYMFHTYLPESEYNMYLNASKVNQVNSSWWPTYLKIPLKWLKIIYI